MVVIWFVGVYVALLTWRFWLLSDLLVFMVGVLVVDVIYDGFVRLFLMVDCGKVLFGGLFLVNFVFGFIIMFVYLVLKFVSVCLWLLVVSFIFQFGFCLLLVLLPCLWKLLRANLFELLCLTCCLFSLLGVGFLFTEFVLRV